MAAMTSRANQEYHFLMIILGVSQFVFLFRIEQSSQQPPTKLQVYQKKVDPTEEGHVIDMAHFDTGRTDPHDLLRKGVDIRIVEIYVVIQWLKLRVLE
jgi:hypothetical protein